MLIVKHVFLLNILLIAFERSQAARILAYFPVPSISHQVVFRPLTQELARRGHEVTVITPDPIFKHGEAPRNFTEIDVHEISYKLFEKFYTLTSSGASDVVGQVTTVFDVVATLAEYHLKVEPVQKLLKEKFDLIFIEACARSPLLLSHMFQNTPVIQISSFGPFDYNINTFGAAWHPLMYPNNFNIRIYNLTMWEKLVELWNFYRLEINLDEIEKNEDEMAKRLFGPNVPSISELKNNVDMLFLNIHPMWEGNRPVPPSVVYMGGLHQKAEKELPEELKKYLDSSKNGVVYMSLGTNVKPSLLPPETLQTFTKVFSTLPYDVLFKFDGDILPGRTDNVKISKWLPQSDLLRHPNVKVFITQGGLQSTDEAITAGIPLIGIPVLADQWYNVEKYVHHKIGIQLDMQALTEDGLRNAIDTVISDESYRRNVIKLGKLMKDQPQRPLERAVWWTEYVLRHGGAKHLRSPAANTTWTQYLELQLVFSVLTVLLMISSVFIFILFKLYKLATVGNSNSKIKSN